jgi:hypothetical protein
MNLQPQLPEAIEQVLIKLQNGHNFIDCFAAVEEALAWLERSPAHEYNQALKDILMFLHNNYMKMLQPDQNQIVLMGKGILKRREGLN